MMKKTLFMVMAVCVLGLVAQAETIVTTADGNGADTFLGNDSNKSATNNYGGANDMDLRNYTNTRSHIGYARWDITSIGGMDPTGAQLRLWITGAQNTRDCAVYALNDNVIDDNWNEMTITYNTAPGFLPTDPVNNGNYIIDASKMTYLGIFTINATDAMTAITVSITPDDPNAANPLVDVLKADTNNKITLAFICPTNGDGRQFYVLTKEGVTNTTDPNFIDLVIPPTMVIPADVDPIWAINPTPVMNEVVTGSLTQLTWKNPEPNLPGGNITCDVYWGTTAPNNLLPDYGLTTLVTGTDSNSVSLPSAPAPLTQYYWVVDVHDSSSGLHRGLHWSYNTFNNPPTVNAGPDQYVWVDKIKLGTDADTWMRDGYTENGDDPLMNVTNAYGFYSYLRFDLSAYNPDDIVDATLTLTKVPGGWRNDTMTNGRFALHGLTDIAGNTAQDWGEMDLTWNNAGAEFDAADPTLATSIADGRLINLDGDDIGVNITETTDGTTMTVTGADLVSFLKARAGNGGLATFVITLGAGGSFRGYALGTKEATDSATVPVLNLTTVTNPGTVNVNLDGTVTDDGQPYATLTYLWEMVSGPETVTISPDNTEDTTVTLGTPGTYVFQLTGNDGQEAVSDTVQVYVGDSACDAAQNVPGYVANIADLNSDCFVDLLDFALMAAEWLACDSLLCP